jgi:hypothetical protein
MPSVPAAFFFALKRSAFNDYTLSITTDFTTTSLFGLS